MSQDTIKTEGDHCFELRTLPENQQLAMFREVVDDFRHAIFLFCPSSGQIACMNEACHKLSKEEMEVLIASLMSDTREHLSTLLIPLEQGEKKFQIECTPFDNDHQYHQVIVRDITEKIARQIREQELRGELQESEERYKELVERQGEGIVEVDMHETFISANPAANKMFGLRKGESLVGRNLREFVPESEFKRIQRKTRKRAKGEPEKYDFKMGIGEKIRIIRVTASPSFDKAGHFAGAYGIFQDVTVLKEVESALKRKASEFDAIFDSDPSLLYFRIGADGTILSHKAKDRKLLYVPETTFIKKRVTDFGILPHDVQALLQEAIKEVATTQKSVQVQYSLFMKEKNKIHHFEATISLLTADQLTVLIRDITEKKLMESQIIEYSRKRMDEFMDILAEKDVETKDHTIGVELVMDHFAAILKLPEDPRRSLLARYHDIGKIGINDAILKKPGELTGDEFKTMELHSEIGFAIAQSSPLLRSVAEWIYMHHKGYDGSGYPRNHKDMEIPLEVRMLAIVDTFETMISGRCWKKRMLVPDIKSEFERCKGKQFDPELVDIFLSHLPEFLDIVQDLKTASKGGKR